MNDQIFETVVSTCSAGGVVHVAPMGVRYRGESVVLKPFKPSTTLDNILVTRLACALEHVLLRLERSDEDPERPTLTLARVHESRHSPWRGFNRAQAAVVEGAVLVSRLHLLPPAKVDAEMRYLQIAIDKTAGAAEREAWEWLQDAVARHGAAALGEAR